MKLGVEIHHFGVCLCLQSISLFLAMVHAACYAEDDGEKKQEQQQQQQRLDHDDEEKGSSPSSLTEPLLPPAGCVEEGSMDKCEETGGEAVWRKRCMRRMFVNMRVMLLGMGTGVVFWGVYAGKGDEATTAPIPDSLADEWRMVCFESSGFFVGAAVFLGLLERFLD
jgi:hypothetical protein